MTTPRTLSLAFGIASLQLVAAGRNAWADVAWGSGPAVITPGSPSPSTVQPAGTVIFGRAGAGSTKLSFLYSDGVNGFLPNGGDVFENDVGFVDSDPAATYVPDGRIVYCAHRTGAGAAMVCGKGSMVPNALNGLPKIAVAVPANAIGTATFDAGSSPAVVAIGSTVYLFARGQNHQLWYTTLDASIQGTLTNPGWFQVPAPSGGGSFDTSPAVVQTSAGGGILAVCAHKTGGSYICNIYHSILGFLGWSTSSAMGTIATTKPALARNTSGTFMFAITDAMSQSDVYAVTSSFGSWSQPAGITGGFGFLAGPDSGTSAVGSATGNVLLVVARDSSGFYWFSYGTATNFDTGWHMINIAP